MNVQIHLGDCREVLAGLPDESFDSIVTDPPYHLTRRARPGGTPTKGFMERPWDGGNVAFQPETWAHCLRVLKPGGYLVAFGATRTYHRLVCAIEDGGFQIRDMIADLVASDTHVERFLASLSVEQQRAFAHCLDESAFGGMLAWVYGKGYPKATRRELLPEAWREGWNTALKPAVEPICLARKPMIGTIAENLEAFGTGAFNIRGCRVGAENGSAAAPDAQGDALGRWPANVCHDGSDEILRFFPRSLGQKGDVSYEGLRPPGHVYNRVVQRVGRGEEPSAQAENAGAVGFRMRPGARRTDSGSAARFFYCGRASSEDRNAGCGDPSRTPHGNDHPTVKPTELMRWLLRLVTPAGGRVLDPFGGSGSTAKAAVLEGMHAVLIDEDPASVAIAAARVEATQPGLALGSIVEAGSQAPTTVPPGASQHACEKPRTAFETAARGEPSPRPNAEVTT